MINKLISRSHFIKLGKMEKTPGDPCCQIKIKTGVQIIGGVLAILSGVLLVVFFAKLDELVSRQYYALFQVTQQICRYTGYNWEYFRLKYREEASPLWRDVLCFQSLSI